MSEIRERSAKYLAVNYPYGGDIITDLLAELERVENSREAECVECEKLACIEMRQQAAREAVEIVGSGGWYNEELEVAIKAHFAIKGE